MKTTNTNKLAFAKKSLVELNDNQMHDINGGTSPFILPSSIIWITVMDQVAN
ncbi:class I lanthipeptide [Flavobacterium sp. CAU 1735]|uniref:class I lanthipeptide n=1 Tax=Flavobacterium sp. CAU 1735 TaxID=3140361 RepID=UPI0032614320